MARDAAWPLEVVRKTYPDGSTLLVELECDEVAVLHITQTSTPESDTLSVAGTHFTMTGEAVAEMWAYLDDKYAARLRDGLSDLLGGEEIDAYTRGLLGGVERYAYPAGPSESGVRYVGTDGTTLVRAREEILRERGYADVKASARV